MEATTQTKNKTNKGCAIYLCVGMLIILILVFVAGFYFNIDIMNKQFDKNNQAISKSHQVNNPLKSLQTDSTKIYNLKEEDLNRFNDHIDYLSDKVEGEVKRTQENNQYDIDRINTFLAIGIGLLAIIGGLLPLVINFFSRESLDKRMDDIQEEAKAIQEASNAAKLAAEGANDKANTASDTVSGLDGKVKEAEGLIKGINEEITPLKDGLKEVKEATRKIPYIDLLVLQNAVAKLSSTDAMKLLIGNERTKWLAAYLENVVLSINSFDEEGHSFENYTDLNLKYFHNVISELKLALFLGPIRRIPDGRSFQEKIDVVVSQLSKFEKMEKKEFKTQLKKVSATITELKTLVENKTIA
jgi:uncharacterized protein (UPF0333 family)